MVEQNNKYFFRTKDGSVQKCTTGYCCANNSGCCINYMELWWFWLIWVRIYCTGVVVVWYGFGGGLY